MGEGGGREVVVMETLEASPKLEMRDLRIVVVVILDVLLAVVRIGWGVMVWTALATI